MRSAGVEIDILLKYMNLLDQGKTTVTLRKKLLEEQREKLYEKKNDIEKTIERLNYKIDIYNEISLGNRKDFTEE